jgi:hypothetical protein
MKKTIATISLAMVMGCGLALAHADDSMSNTTSNKTTTGDTGSVQQPGTVAGSNDTTTDHMAGPDTNSNSGMTSSETKSTTAMKSKSCTDDTGKVLHKGQTGFKACMKNMKEQMGGTADQSTTEIHKHTDSVNPSDMSNTPSHDTSGNSGQ